MPEFDLSLTVILIALTALISISAFSNPSLRDRLVFHPYSIAQSKQYYRFISHGFIHANWEHLLINMYVFYIFGGFLENVFQQVFPGNLGPVLFGLLYLGGIVVAAVPSYFQHRTDPGYRSLGASGATSGLVFAFILFNPWEWFLFPPLPALVFGLAYLWYSNYMARRGRDHIAHDAHFWGAIFGLVFTLSVVSWFQPGLLQFFWEQLLQGPKLPF